MSAKGPTAPGQRTHRAQPDAPETPTDWPGYLRAPDVLEVAELWTITRADRHSWPPLRAPSLAVRTSPNGDI